MNWIWAVGAPLVRAVIGLLFRVRIEGAGKIPELNVYGPAHTARLTELVIGEGGIFGPDLAARTELPMSQAVFVARGGTLPRAKPRRIARGRSRNN